MDEMKPIRSVSFDTSFLLKESPIVDQVIHILVKDRILCFLTTTVVSELEQLKIWGRITTKEYKRASRRWKQTHAQLIDFRNRLLSDAFGRACIQSMEKHHGVKPEDIANDCNIIISALKQGIDLFLSEDYHFTSKITKKVLEEVTNAACTEYHQMCGNILYSIDADTFTKAYHSGSINLDIIKDRIKTIRKKGKRL